MASILGGGLIAVVTMLYGTIENIILIVGLEVEDHPLIYQDDSEESHLDSEKEQKKDSIKEQNDIDDMESEDQGWMPYQ